jgi:hypothetical protein
MFMIVSISSSLLLRLGAMSLLDDLFWSLSWFQNGAVVAAPVII